MKALLDTLFALRQAGKITDGAIFALMGKVHSQVNQFMTKHHWRDEALQRLEEIRDSAAEEIMENLNK